MFPTVAASEVPWVTTAEMREVDRLMIDHYGIALIQMMENAGRNLAALIVEAYQPASAMVLAGTGGNGGGALAAARHLHNRGVDVHATITDADRLTPVPQRQFEALARVGVEIVEDPRPADVVVDGVLGYSLDGAPRGRAAELIGWCEGRSVVSLDTPSGLDTTTGTAPGVVVMATATATLAAPKSGLRIAPQVGGLFLLDISVPRELWDDLRIAPPPPLAPITRIE